MNTNDIYQTAATELTRMPAEGIFYDNEVAEAVRMMAGTVKPTGECTPKLFVDRYVATAISDSIQSCSKTEAVTGDYAAFRPGPGFIGAVIQYPNSEGSVEEYDSFIRLMHGKGIKVAVVTDLMALAMLKAPGQSGADMVILDSADKTVAQSDAKTLKDTAARIHGMASYFNDALEVYGYGQENTSFFNTLKISLPEDVSLSHFREVAEEYGTDFRYFEDGHVGASINKDTDEEALSDLIEVFATAAGNFPTPVDEEEWGDICSLDDSLLRTDNFTF